MVLEILVNPAKVQGKPWEMFFIGVVYSLVGVMLGYWVFRSHVSLVMVAFTSIAAIPFVHSALKAEESRLPEGKELTKEKTLARKYAGILMMFTFLFLGFVAAFVSLFVLLPETAVSHIFSTQVNAIGEVRSSITGNFTATLATLFTILLNNLKVLFFCLLFSVVYGAGAIFILSWNASVMGAAIGGAIRDKLIGNAGTALQIVSTSLAGYFVHGIPEIVAYFAGGLAGGVLSVALVKEGYRSTAFTKAGRDCLHLTAFAALLLFFAGLIEVYISPTLL